MTGGSFKAMKEFLKNIYIVLVEPKQPGNIGSVVRAMKNMGLSQLRLVNPVAYRDVGEQRKMGYRSQEIIAATVDFPDLASALADISLVFLATSRKGKWKKDFLAPPAAAERICQHAHQGRVAVVFGREDKGVTIDECQLANYLITIPAAVSYPSLNLSQAVMVVVYEIYQRTGPDAKRSSMPRTADKRSFMRIVDNIWELMKSMEVREPDNGLFHRSLKRAVNRAHWTTADIAVFDRFCKQVRWYIQARCRFDRTEDHGPEIL